MGYVNDVAQAQDLTQETFVAVWQHLDKFRDESAIGTWIFRIATNLCLRTVARDKRMLPASMPENLPVAEDVPDDGRVKLLHKAIAELEGLDRILISLVLEGLPQPEIAEISGLTEVNVRVRTHRIREKLATKIKAYERGR